MLRVLLAADNPDLSHQLEAFLAANGYIVECALNGAQAHHLCETERFDCILLDQGLSKVEGLSVLRRLRSESNAVPVLALTTRGAWSENLARFDPGADDYLAKPFQTVELLSRLRDLIRRTAGRSQPMLVFGEMRVDPQASRVCIKGEPVQLTSLESRLLRYLMTQQSRVISRTELEHLYGQDFDREFNTIDVFIHRLRKKIGNELIETVQEVGWRLKPIPN